MLATPVKESHTITLPLSLIVLNGTLKNGISVNLTKILEFYFLHPIYCQYKMATSTLNYFTCTLGQAVIWKNESLQQLKSINTVLDLVERQASTYPQSLALGFADSPFKEAHNSMFTKLSLAVASVLKCI